MTHRGQIYRVRQMLAGPGTASLFLTGTPPIRQDPMNRTLASADTAHYYQRPPQLSTLPTARRSRLGLPAGHYGRVDRKGAGGT